MPISEEKRLEILFSPIEEIGKMIRLILGLSAGAVVLFVNLLANLQSNKWALFLLVLSILAFGLATVWCVSLALGILRLRTIVVAGIQDETESWQANVDAKLKNWTQQTIKDARKVQVFFLAGVFFAAAFVFAAWLTRTGS